MNLQFPADSLWVSSLPPIQRHLDGCNTQRAIVKYDGKRLWQRAKSFHFYIQAGVIAGCFSHQKKGKFRGFSTSSISIRIGDIVWKTPAVDADVFLGSSCKTSFSYSTSAVIWSVQWHSWGQGRTTDYFRGTFLILFICFCKLTTIPTVKMVSQNMSAENVMDADMF